MLNMKHIITILLLFVPLLVFSQKKFKNKYKDKLEKGSRLMISGYNFSIEKTKSGKGIYKKYYPETGQMTHFISLDRAIRSKAKEGKYMEWYDDGTEWISGYYTNGLKTGEWKYTDNNGGVRKGTYQNGIEEGEWIDIDSSGHITKKYIYKNGKLNGKYIYYDTIGNVAMEKIYLEDELLNTNIMDSTYLNTNNNVEILPSFQGCESLKDSSYNAYKKCSDNKMLMYIYKRIRYPRIARENSVEGKVQLQFVINKKGEVENIKVLRGVCQAIQEECISLVKSMPTWHPGTVNGEAVNVQFVLPIAFRLE